MDAVFKGSHPRMMIHLKRVISAHRAVDAGIATHAEKERDRREKYATARRATEAISGPFKGTGKPV